MSVSFMRVFIALIFLLTGCDGSEPASAKESGGEATAPKPDRDIAQPASTKKTASSVPRAVQPPAPVAAVSEAVEVIAPTPPWTVTARGHEVLLNRPECAVSIRLGTKMTSISVRAACPPPQAPSARDLSAALGTLLRTNPGAGERLTGLWTGPMARLDRGAWARAVGMAAAKDPRWKTRAERRRGEPSQNQVYVELANGSGALKTLQEAFGDHGLTVSLRYAEKVFARPAHEFGGAAGSGGRLLPYDAGSHAFTLSRKTP